MNAEQGGHRRGGDGLHRRRARGRRPRAARGALRRRLAPRPTSTQALLEIEDALEASVLAVLEGKKKIEAGKELKAPSSAGSSSERAGSPPWRAWRHNESWRKTNVRDGSREPDQRVVPNLASSPSWPAPRRRRADPVVWTPDLAFQVKRVSQVAVSPDGKRVAYVVATAQMEGEKSEWLSQIWRGERGRDGRPPAHPRARSRRARPPGRPTGKWIAFVSARGGKPQMWRMPVGGGEAERLTDEKSAPGAPALLARRQATSRS